MGQIVKFPEQPGASSSDTPDTGRAFAWWASMLRPPLFLVLYWLRLPVMLVCNLVSVPALLAFLVGLWAFPEHRPMVWGVGAISFAAFALRWAYDALLMRLAPRDVTFML
jgi:hypothetical protein